MRSRWLVVAVALALAPVVLFAQRGVRIQLGSILPANSVWDKVLKEMATEWQRETDGRVELRVLAGNVKDEGSLARRLKAGRPQAAVFGFPGDIDEAFKVLNIPFFFESDEETLHVVEKLTPRFEKVLADQGLVLLNWGHAGWAHFFTADRVESLDDLRRTKLYTGAGGEKMLQWYKENGFNPEPLAVTDVLLGLNTGLINAHPSPPYAALLFQWYEKTPFMLDIPLAPILGITVVTEGVWSQVSAEDRLVLLASAKRVEQDLFRQVPAQERESIAEMKTRGLTVVEPSDAQRAAFRVAADGLTASWRGTMIPADVYDMALRERDAFRAAR
ncbi:MAG: TRAP transporter substrate-binding protein DctP [Acidobacteria bacterium]|nr:TRAP transporter substrate-binding protein DctP [Acidobacteriota bacterium]